MKTTVTVAVTSYNSVSSIIETLESIYEQTYSNIDLIISDDFSMDNTLKLVDEWILQDRIKHRFSRIEVIKVPKNTGVSANCNRCIAASKSEWIKFIAGDDILLPNCIEDNIRFAENTEDANIIFSQIKVYQDDFKEVNFVRVTPDEFPNNLMHPTFSGQEQYQLLLVSDRIHYTPSYFFNKKALLKVGGYDESNRLVEDYPMWLKLTSSGEKLHYFHTATVGYRIHSKATNNVGDNVLFKPSIFNTFAIRKKLAHPYLPWAVVKSEEFVYNASRIFQNLGLNKKHKLNSFLYRAICFYMNPYHYLYAFQKRLPSNKNNLFYS